MKTDQVLGVQICSVCFTPTAKMPVFVGTCVYVHRRSTDGQVFYVGIGSRNRACAKAGRSQAWHAVAAEHGREVEIVKVFDRPRDAAELEIKLIAAMREAGVELVNTRPGGEGAPYSTATPDQAMKDVLQRMVTMNKERALRGAIAAWREAVLKPYQRRMGLPVYGERKRPRRRGKAAVRDTPTPSLAGAGCANPTPGAARKSEMNLHRHRAVSAEI